MDTINTIDEINEIDEIDVEKKLKNIRIALKIVSINLAIRLILNIFNFQLIDFLGRLIIFLLSISISYHIKSNLDNSCLTITSLSSICLVCCFIYPDIITFIGFGFFFLETVKIALDKYTDLYFELKRKILFHVISIPLLILIALKSLSMYYGLFENLYNTEKAFYFMQVGNSLTEFEDLVPHSINVEENLFKGPIFSSDELVAKAYLNVFKDYYVTAKFKIRDGADLNHLTSDDYICISKTLNYGNDIQNISSKYIKLYNISLLEEFVGRQTKEYFEENYEGYLENYVSSYEEYLPKAQIRIENIIYLLSSSGTTINEWKIDDDLYRNMIFADTSGNYVEIYLKNYELQTVRGYINDEKISIDAITPESL
jgi:hypothetical protein